MTVAVRGRLPTEPAKAFQEIQERLIALEKDAAGATVSFTSPSVPPFGAGLPGVIGGGGGSVPVPPPLGASDHGALTGLLDDDHPQYVEHGDAVKPHGHGPFDVSGLDQRFVNLLERVLPAHVHGPFEVVGLETRFPDRFERVISPHTHGAQDILGLEAFSSEGRAVKPHAHVMADVADLQATDVQFVLAARIFGG